MKQTESTTAKAETGRINPETTYEYNLVQQKVRIGNKADSFSINVAAMLPAIQDMESTREAKCKPIEYTQGYLDWLMSEMVKANGIKEACTRVFNKCVMIQFNQAFSKLLGAEYAKAMLARTDKSKAVSKADLEATISKSDLISFYNDKHTLPEGEKADSMLSSTKRKVDKANKMRLDNGLPAWTEEEISSKVSALYAIELAKQAEQNLLLS